MAVYAPEELDGMRDLAWVLREIARDLARAVKPGATTASLDRLAADLVETYGVRSSFKGYRGYPATITTSVNEEVIDGVPGPRPLAEGDVLKLQLGITDEGHFAYWAHTYGVGTLPGEAAVLVSTAGKALKDAVDAARPGADVSVLSERIERVLKAEGAEPVRQYCGHGIGRRMHEEPRIPCYVEARLAGRYALQAGEVLALQVLATNRPTRLKPAAGGLTVSAEPGVRSVHLGAIVAVGEPPEVLCAAG